MVKNQVLPSVICTPTTKDDVHDRPISGAEVVGEGWMSAEDWAYTEGRALALFAFGQETAAKRGLILVDTKYEFGRDAADGTIRLIDEVHTPDSSRYWLADSYAARMAAGQEPENIDKEFLRIWFRDHCDPYHDITLPDAPTDLVLELSRRYIMLYERITGATFALPAANAPAPADALAAAVAHYFPASPSRARIVVLSSLTWEPDKKAVAAAAEALTSSTFPAKPAATAASKAGAAASGSLPAPFPEATDIALEHYAVDAAASPLSLVQLCQDVAKEATGVTPIATVFIAVSVGRPDDVSRVVAAQTRSPVIALLGSGTGDAGNSHVLSALGACPGTAVVVSVDPTGAAHTAQRLMRMVPASSGKHV
jgi:hypothetical protein